MEMKLIIKDEKGITPEQVFDNVEEETLLSFLSFSKTLEEICEEKVKVKITLIAELVDGTRNE
jgi:hypothetical protein